jgi:transcriptional regulator with XRE-family HTH domain
LILTEELKRAAQAEGVTMEEAMEALSDATGYSVRQIYNWRGGSQPIPAAALPALCQRFGSRSLLDAVTDACAGTRVDVPELFDLDRLCAQVIRSDMAAVDKFLAAFEDARITRAELAGLNEAMTAMISNVRRLYAIAEADCQRRQVVQGRQVEAVL